jgi:hypothetical protein
MIESPLVQEWQALAWREATLTVLKQRFGTVARDVRRLLTEATGIKRLKKLHESAISCKTIADFRDELLG